MEGHRYGFMLVNWPLEGHTVEGVHRVALMVEMGLTRSLNVSHLSMRRSASTRCTWYLSPMPGTGNKYIAVSRVHDVGHTPPPCIL